MRVKLILPKIMEVMTRKELNQTKLAQKAGMARQTLCTAMSRGSCSLETAQKLADALGLALWEIAERMA